MSFLENLENNLKSLESREGADGMDEARRREAERQRTKASAPWAERLKLDPWTQNFMRQVTRAGFERRIKVNLAWIGTTLRMEARGARLELQPLPDGISAVFLRDGEEMKREIIDLSGDPRNLVMQWMSVVDAIAQ